MKKFQLSLMALALTVVPAAARQLTPAEALSAAGMASETTSVLRAPSDLKLVYTTEKNDIKTSYVFNRKAGNGFVILAADDVAAPVIGYSDNGTFDPNNIPYAMKGYLENISDEIAWGAENPSSVRKSAAEATDYEPVSPLCNTMWGQSEPYNIKCPIRTYQGASYYCMTGCVATAMAQIMKVHEWPVTGTGSHAYQYQDNYVGGSFYASSNFAEHTYDWANMVNSYNNSESTAQKNAVAQLMFDCGVSVDMYYSPVASGATGIIVPSALASYFSYDLGMQYILRENYPIAEWNAIAYNEVSQGRPTLITGSNPSGGHAFVCDGYDKNGFFHINWGWEGISDGFFLLTALDPAIQDIGGSDGGYTSGQGMTIGIKPAVAGTKAVINITCDGASFATGAESYSRSSNVQFGNGYSQFINWTATQNSVSGSFGVKLVNKSNGEVTYAAGSETSLVLGQYIMRYYVPGSAFPENGDFIATPAFKSEDGEWIDIRYNISYNSSVSCHIEGDNISFTPIDEGSISVSGLATKTKAFVGYPLTYTFDLTSTRPEWIGSIQSKLYRKINNKYVLTASGKSEQLTITGGETRTFTWQTDFSENASLQANTYYLRIIDSGDYVLAEIPVEFEANPGELVLGDNAFYAQTAAGETELGGRTKPLVINPTDKITFKLSITSGYLAGDMAKIGVYNLSGFVVNETEKFAISGVAGETISIEIPAQLLDGLQEKTTYYLRVTTDNNGAFPTSLGLRTPVYFQLSEEAGIDDVIANPSDLIAIYPNPAQNDVTIAGAEIDNIEIFSLTGANVASLRGSGSSSVTINVDNLTAGNYIVRITTSEGEVAVKRLIKK